MKTASALLLLSLAAFAGDWTTFGRTRERNMVSPETGLVSNIVVVFNSNTGAFDLSSSVNVKWAAPTGYLTYGTAAVSGGRVILGTSLYGPIRKYSGDRGVLLCLTEATGKLLWQLSIPRGPSGAYLGDYPLGLCSAPTVEGERAYFAGFNAEVFCVDLAGLGDGNDGPFTNEAALSGGSIGSAVLDATDGDVVWRHDTLASTGIMPHDAYACSPLLVGDLLFVNSGLGITRDHKGRCPYTNGEPALIALDKKTGALVARDEERMGAQVPHGSWCNPTLGEPGGKPLVIYGGGDGICYGFSPKPESGAGNIGRLRKIWWFDPNAHRGPGEARSEIVSAPVCVGKRVYVTLGEDWSHRRRQGLFACFDASGEGELTQKGKLWVYTNLAQSVSSPVIDAGLVYVTDLAGKLHCLDAETGAVQWVFDSGSPCWQTPLVADGKLYFGNSRGRFYILRHGRTLEQLCMVSLRREMAGSPIAANGVVYVATYGMLYAFAAGK